MGYTYSSDKNLPILIPRMHATISNAFIFPVLPHPPLTKPEAKLCICELVGKLCKALEEIHKMGFAHLDVRLPNICFRQSGEAVFIDPDRIAIAEADAHVLNKMYECILYKPKSQWTMEAVDWKQLGYLIGGVFNTNMNR